MNVQLIEAKDYEDARRLCEEKGFPFPASEEIIGALVAFNSNVVGVGVIRTIHEAIIAVDSREDKATRAAAFKGLITQGMFYSQYKKVTEWHSFVEDSNVAHSLRTTFGFKDCRGQPMILNFGGSHGQEGTKTS